MVDNATAVGIESEREAINRDVNAGVRNRDAGKTAPPTNLLEFPPACGSGFGEKHPAENPNLGGRTVSSEGHNLFAVAERSRPASTLGQIPVLEPRGTMRLLRAGAPALGNQPVHRCSVSDILRLMLR